MKIYTSNYRYHWISPYTIMEKVLFWKKWTDPEFDLYDDKNDKYTDWLVKPMQVVMKVLDFIHPKITYVKLDRWDTWNMDSTLALIILPMLKQLHATKQGAPCVDDEDVPEELKSTSAPAKENEWDTDDNHFKRWDWVMEELIWTFEQLHPDTDWMDQYCSGEHDTLWVPSEQLDDKGKPLTYEMKAGPKNTFKMNHDAIKLHDERIARGLKLFGKYYRGLWD
jgi:hypothetical protein